MKTLNSLNIQEEVRLVCMVDNSVLSFKAFEFEITNDQGVYVEEMEDYGFWFRIEINKETDERSIFLASSDEFYIHEDATADFGNDLIHDLLEHFTTLEMEGKAYDATYEFFLSLIEDLGQGEADTHTYKLNS
jgi:hypothetical protein